MLNWHGAQQQAGWIRAPAVGAPRTSGSNAASWWFGPHPLPHVAQGTYVMVLPVSTITANFLAGVPR